MADLVPGTVLGNRFEVVGILGYGGMATVYLARDRLREEEVEHQEWIKLELGKLPATKDVPGDQSDEPVAH